MKNKKVRLVIIITLIITITSFYSMNIMAADVNDSSSDTNTEALQNNSQTTSADQSTDTSVKAKSETPNTANTDSSTMKSSKTVKAFKAKATTIKNDYNFKSDWTNKISDSKTLKYNYIDSDNETFVNSSFYNNSLKLGLAGNFAIVGYSKVKNSAHTNGNILTSELEYGSNFGCNQENGQVSYIKKFTNIANYTAGPHPAADLLVVGNSVGVGLEDNNTAFSFNGSKINSPYNVAKDSTTKQYLDMDTAKNESINISQTLASYKNQGIAQNLTTNNITLTNDTNGYLNVYNATAGDINSSKINVKLSDTKGTSTLINIDAKGTSTINLQGLNLYINGTPLKTVETGEYSGGKIIINVYDSTRSDKLYTGTVNIAGATYASILAPHATLNLNSNVNGTVIGDVVNINAESHQTNFTGTLRTLPTTISKTVVKKWSDNNNLDGLRPSSVDVQLYANGTAVGEKETLDADNDWTYKWPELEQYSNGTEIKYTVKEISNVDGYLTTYSDDTFTITNTQETKTVKFSKTAVNGTKELEGAKLKVVKGNSADGDEVGSWTSTDQMHELSLNYGETYTMVETTAPDNYDKAESITFTIDKDGKIVIDGKTQDSDIVKMQDAVSTTSVSFSKTDINGTSELKGAKLKVITALGVVVDEWTSGSSAHEISGLKYGETYIMVETTAPDNYDKAESIMFTINKDGKVVIGNTEQASNKVVMQDAVSKKTVKFSKTAVNGTKELEGAKLKVVKGNSADGDEVGSWTSTDQMHELSLNYGETYTMVETTAPDNYDKAESITFTINKDGKVVIGNTEQANNIVKMQDAVSKKTVKFSKTAVNGTKELEGAKLKVVKGNSADGDEVGSWTSTDQMHELSLNYGETYTMVETTAPDNYDKAESITFTIDKDGKIVIDGKTQDSDIVKMQDAVSTTSVSFSKTDINGTSELKGAKLKVITALGVVVDEWTSGSSAHEISGLKYGETYTMVETTAPDNYDKAESITFTIDKDGNIVIDGKTQDSDIVKMQDATNVSKTVKKVWNDNDNKSGYRPDSIKVQLYVNGVAKGDPEMLNAANGWKYTWSALARTLEGKEINYTVKEVTELSNYVTTYSDDTFTITNSLKSSGSGGNNAYNHNSGKPNNNVPGKPDSNNNGKPNISNLSNPNTGDDTNLWLQLSILGLALTGLGTSFYTLHRKEKD